MKTPALPLGKSARLRRELVLPRGRLETGSTTVRERVLELPITRETAPSRRTTSSRSGMREARVNRAFNFGIALALLIIVAPIMVLVAIAVKLTSPGPILYRQTRVGLDRRRRAEAGTGIYDRRIRDLGGRAFRIYKFRSMRTNAEQRSGAVWATRGDPRVTPIGRILRKSRLDELPQLFNVLKGDMNLVGPRPERPSIFVHLAEGIPEYPARQRAKPGITGWAQVNQQPDSSIDDVRRKVSYDLEYIERQSVVEDLRILMQTVPVVFFLRKGW